jgi:hypothetical protein
MGTRLAGRSAGYTLGRPFPTTPHSGLSQSALRAAYQILEIKVSPAAVQGTHENPNLYYAPDARASSPIVQSLVGDWLLKQQLT